MATSTLDIRFHIHSTLFRHPFLLLTLISVLSPICPNVSHYPFCPRLRNLFHLCCILPNPILTAKFWALCIYILLLLLCRRSTDVSFSPFQVSISSVFISRHLSSRICTLLRALHIIIYFKMIFFHICTHSISIASSVP